MSGALVATPVDKMGNKLESDLAWFPENAKEKANKIQNYRKENAPSRILDKITMPTQLKTVPAGKVTAQFRDGRTICKNGVHAHVTVERGQYPAGPPGVPGANAVPRVEMQLKLDLEHVPSRENVLEKVNKQASVTFLSVKQPNGRAGAPGLVVAPHVEMQQKVGQEHVLLKESVLEKVNKETNATFLSARAGPPGVSGADAVPPVEMQLKLDPEHVRNLENVLETVNKPTNAIFLSV